MKLGQFSFMIGINWSAAIDSPETELSTTFMPTVAQIAGNIRIEQRYKEHNPPHFHAIQGDDEASIEIALPLRVLAGGLKAGALSDVRDWARAHRAALALNWVDSLARATMNVIR